MQHVILGLLLRGPLSMYDLHKQVLAGVALFYAASYGSLQRALVQLERAGHIRSVDASTGRRARKEHSITEAGRAAWHAWMTADEFDGDEETAMLARVFFLGDLDVHDRTRVIATLTGTATATLTELESVAAALDATDAPPEYADILRYRRATLDYGIRAHRNALDWLGELA